jgi:tetratricopeptide (TPR) repeat protein
MAVTTTNKQAQRWFNQGLNLLHDFMYFEAYRAFVEATKADSSCAMAYWGIVMAMPGAVEETNSQRRKALEKALDLPASEKEKRFIETAEVLVNQGLNASYPAFRKLYQTYPDEPEAVAFAAIMLRFGAEADWAESRAITEQALKKFPDHAGLIHYYLHIMELSPEFERAMPYLPVMTRLAGGVSHILHMPGHFYFLQGRYQKAADTFKQAHLQDEVYHKSQRVLYLNNDNYLHNLHYWAVSLAEAGDQKNALAVATQYANVSTSAGRNRSSGMLMIQYEGQVMPALVYMRFGNWQKAIDYLSARQVANPIASQFKTGLLAYCQAMYQLEASQPTGLASYLQTLENARQALYVSQQQVGVSPEQERIKRALDILTVGQAELAGWMSNLDPAKPLDQAAFFQALKLEKRIGYQEPPRLFCPVFERIGDFFRQRNDLPNARQVYEKALQQRPNSPIILAKLAATR